MINDEIKEILDYLKIENGNCSSELSYEETHLLLDYITNLQQELETRQYDINNLTYQLAKEKEENGRLKLEIERLNDVLLHKPDEKIMLKTNDGKELFVIQSERIDMQEELNKANMQLMAQLEDYKSRCEKADEKIKKHLYDKKFLNNTHTSEQMLNIVSNILNGRSDE